MRAMPFDSRSVFSTGAIPPGNIGNRLDGWPNRDLNVGAIIASAPTVKPFADLLSVDEATVRKVLTSGARASSMPS